jgi:hypothetical protein
MPAYAVFEPPPSRRRRGEPVLRFVFMREGFNWRAFLFGPLWMIGRRLWLVLVMYTAIIAGLAFGLQRLEINWPASLSVYVLIELLVGLEATRFRRNALLRRGWNECGIVFADALELAERRFFDARAARQQAAAKPLNTPSAALGVMPASPGVIGLFPEPGGGL